eukprot:11465420-Ditylum_brightwellii.AAC.1
MEINRVQDIVGTLLYYSHAINPTLAAVLSTIASQQANATKRTEEACHQLLDYVATNPNAAAWFLASNMILTVHLDTSYLCKTNARSRAAGHFCLTKHGDDKYNNGAILTLSTII